MVETLVVFNSEGHSSTEWNIMAKLAFNILLKCAEAPKDEDIEIQTMATAKLHALVQTRYDLFLVCSIPTPSKLTQDYFIEP